MNTPFIPARTRAELQSPAPVGQRHEQMKKAVLPLLGGGLAPEAVFVQLRGMYGPDVSDREIHDLIEWAASKNPQPCGNGYERKATFSQVSLKPRRVTAEQATAATEKWLGEFRCDECDLFHVSPWQPLEDWRSDFLMLAAALYDKTERLNVITEYS